MIAEDEIERSPRDRTTPPFVPEKSVPVLSIDQMRALLDHCQGREFVQVRDTAIIRLLLDSGGRLGEISALTVTDTLPRPQREQALHAMKIKTPGVGIEGETAE